MARRIVEEQNYQLGRRLKYLRENCLHLSQKEFASYVGMKADRYNALENGERIMNQRFIVNIFSFYENLGVPFATITAKEFNKGDVSKMVLDNLEAIQSYSPPNFSTIIF
ncbi:MAG: helix-turn-helix transcriptional regulator [Bacteroidales bacterium]|nr:helix-turn-helix transcriptional regulator [Candidatus Physcocola equi]